MGRICGEMTLEGFKNFASRMTRAEFETNIIKEKNDEDGNLEYFLKIDETTIIHCPCELDLNEDLCTVGMSCKSCWLRAVEYISFKDDFPQSCEPYRIEEELSSKINRMVESLEVYVHKSRNEYLPANSRFDILVDMTTFLEKGIHEIRMMKKENE